MVPSAEKNWILIRGLSRGAGHWASFTNKIKTHFPNDHFYCVDIPGNGYLNQIKTPLNIHDFIPYFEQQLIDQGFNFQLPTYGLSLSLGSMSMVEWSLQKPDRFQKMIIMNTSAANFSNVLQRLSTTALLLGFKIIFNRKNLRQREILSLLATTSLTQQQIETDFKNDLQLIENFSRAHATNFLNTLKQLIAAALYSFPQKAPCKVLLLNGARDKFVSPKCSQAIAQKWNLPLTVHPEAGHDIAFQFPDWVINIMSKMSADRD